MEKYFTLTNKAIICRRVSFLFCCDSLSQEYLQTCMNKLENLFEQHRRLCYSMNITQQNSNNNCNSSTPNATTTTNTTSNNTSNSSNCNVNGNTNKSTSSTNTNSSNSPSSMLDPMTPTQQPNIEIATKSQSGTPTDVQDVSF